MSRSYMHVAPMRAPGASVHLPAGRVPDPPLDTTRPPVVTRRLNSRAIRKSLAPAPAIIRDWTLEVLDDLSGSMTGGNDALGLRHEVLLILTEHLMKRRGRGPHWSLRARSFDNGGTAVDRERLPLTRRHLGQLERALLGQTFGGSSNLGPCLDASIAGNANRGETGLIRLVLSDFELFDSDVTGVLHRLAQAPADLNMALVFRAPVPDLLDAELILTRHVDPTIDEPADLAHLIMNAIIDTVDSRSG